MQCPINQISEHSHCFLVYLMTICHLTLNSIKWKITWLIMSRFLRSKTLLRFYPAICLEMLKKIVKNLSKHLVFQLRFKSKHSKHKAGALTTSLLCSTVISQPENFVCLLLWRHSTLYGSYVHKITQYTVFHTVHYDL